MLCFFIIPVDHVMHTQKEEKGPNLELNDIK